MFEEYYNKNTETLTIPFSFMKKLKNLPLVTKIIISEDNPLFNQQVDNLPNTIKDFFLNINFVQK